MFNILRFLKNKEIAYKEFEILREQSKIGGGTGEINVAIWRQNRVVIKKVNKFYL